MSTQVKQATELRLHNSDLEQKYIGYKFCRKSAVLGPFRLHVNLRDRT